MKLQALDQIHVSAVKPDSLRPGEEFEVLKDLGTELLAKHPSGFLMVSDAEPGEPADAEAGEKAESPPPNKADGRRKTKAE